MTNNFVTLADIDKFLYDWLNDYSQKYGFSKWNGWIKAQQNAPAPQLPYGTWHVRDMTKVGHRDQYQVAYNDINGVLVVDDFTFYQFTVEITSLGYGSDDMAMLLSQAFDTDDFAFRSGVSHVGYQSHTSSTDISAVADAEVREARQFTVTFNCVMRLRDATTAIERVEVSTDMAGGESFAVDGSKEIRVVNHGIPVYNNGRMILNSR